MNTTFSDIRYAEDSVRNLLNHIMPLEGVRPPLVVFIHGGAFFMGDKSDSPL